MDTSLERIRAKIAELEAKIADLRIAEREIRALEKLPSRTTRPGPGPTPKRKPEASNQAEVRRRDRGAYQGDRPRHQQSNRILFAAIVEKARPRQERGWQVDEIDPRSAAPAH